MKRKKQVEKAHYEFKSYMSKARWASVWHQLDELVQLNPKSILEIGPGPGVFKNMALLFGLPVETLDLDPELKPDHVGSATEMPFNDRHFDVVCAFQVLEHLPYKMTLEAFNEMVRVSQRYVVISLPDVRPRWRYVIHIPKLGECGFYIPRPQLKAKEHKFDGEHYWEINKKGYSLDRITKDFTSCGVKLKKTYRVPEFSYHRFFIFEK